MILVKRVYLFGIISMAFVLNACTHYEARGGNDALAWVQESIYIDAPVREVWALVADKFDENSKHMLGVNKSYYQFKADSMIGSVRRSEHAGDDFIDVQITHWDKAAGYLQWRITQTNFFMLKKGVGAYTLRAEGDGTRLIQDGGFRLSIAMIDGIAKKQMRSMFKSILAGIKLQIEDGKEINKGGAKQLVRSYKKSYG
ncbi:MAG: hypothetical protein ACI93R_003396 [Flavobacteriales bacterium]|jgi:hypothetical protein